LVSGTPFFFFAPLGSISQLVSGCGRPPLFLSSCGRRYCVGFSKRIRETSFLFPHPALRFLFQEAILSLFLLVLPRFASLPFSRRVLRSFHTPQLGAPLFSGCRTRSAFHFFLLRRRLTGPSLTLSDQFSSLLLTGRCCPICRRSRRLPPSGHMSPFSASYTARSAPLFFSHNANVLDIEGTAFFSGEKSFLPFFQYEPHFNRFATRRPSFPTFLAIPPGVDGP